MNIKICKTFFIILQILFAAEFFGVMTVKADTELTGPATLDMPGEYYRLTRDITTSGTGFTITANDVTLDLGEYTISYGSGPGVKISADRVTLKNGTIIQIGTNSSAHGISASGSSNELHHLLIKVLGPESHGIQTNTFNSGKIHHVYINNEGSSSLTAPGPAGISLQGGSSQGLQIYENIIVGSHKGMLIQGVSLRASQSPNPGKVYNNYIQHDRIRKTKADYGIVLAQSTNFNIYKNQIITDQGRGIIFDGWYQGSDKPTRYVNFHDNRLDVQHSPNPREGDGGYSSGGDGVYGIMCRYGSGYNTVQDNIIMVDNDLYSYNRAIYFGSDGLESSTRGLLIQDNTVIARDSGGESRKGAYVFFWGPTQEVTVTNNKYYTDGNLNGCWRDDTIQNGCWDGVQQMTFTGNTEMTVSSYTPARPIGLKLTKFLDSYLLEWNDNRNLQDETQTYEYIIYRDGQKLPISPRGGTFYVDVDVRDTHTYSVSALTLSGNEGPRCPEVSTTTAQNAWSDESTGPPLTYQCSDGIDNDADGLIDYPEDPGCSSTTDSDEYNALPSDTTPPTTPINLQAAAVSSSQINLSWSASSDNVGVSGYKIYRNNTQISSTASTSYQDTGLSPSTTYNYHVTAYDAAGNETGQSSSASATTQSPLQTQCGQNIALNRPVEDSGPVYDSMTGSKSVDGIKNTSGNYWAGKGCPNWIIIDLQDTYTIDKIIARPYGLNGNRYYYDNEWNIKYSLDKTNWYDLGGVTKVKGNGTLLNNGIQIVSGNPGEGNYEGYKKYEFAFNPTDVRYIRFYVSKGDVDNDANLEEIEIYSFCEEGSSSEFIPPEPPMGLILIK